MTKDLKQFIPKNLEVVRQKIVDKGGDWAEDKVSFLCYVLDKINSSTYTVSPKRRAALNKDIIHFAWDYLTLDQFDEFFAYYKETLTSPSRFNSQVQL